MGVSGRERILEFSFTLTCCVTQGQLLNLSGLPFLPSVKVGIVHLSYRLHCPLLSHLTVDGLVRDPPAQDWLTLSGLLRGVDLSPSK